MNILYISYDGLTEPLVQSQVLSYLKGLARKNINFSLMTFDKKSPLKDKRESQFLKEKLRKENGINWISLKYHKAPTLPATTYDVIRGIIFAFYIALKKKTQIIHSRSYVSMLIALPVCKLLKLKVIFDMRGMWPDEKVDAGLWKKNGFLYKSAKFFEKLFLLNSDAVIVLTDNMKNIIQGAGFLKNRNTIIDVIPTCVDLKRFQNLKESANAVRTFPALNNKFVCLYAGAVGPLYCIREMLEFFKKMKGLIKNAHLVLLTPYNPRMILNDAEGIDMTDATILNIPHEDMPKWLCLGNVGIAFYKPSYSLCGRCPTKLWEYLSCGIPVVLNSGVGDCDDIITANRVGVLLKGFDEKSYEEAISNLNYLLKDGQLKDRCRATAHKYASLDEGISHYHRIYTRIFNSSKWSPST